MAKLEKVINGNFEQILSKIEKGILEGNISATLEDSSDFNDENSRCSVRIFERYSAMGGNRVSLSVTLFQCDNSKIYVSAITSGGSQAILLKVNTIGEKAFLNRLNEIL